MVHVKIKASGLEEKKLFINWPMQGSGKVAGAAHCSQKAAAESELAKGISQEEFLKRRMRT